MPDTRLEMIEEMLEANPDDAFLNYAAALEFWKIDDTEKALKLMEGVVDKNPEYLPAYYQLGKLYEENARIKDAASVYRRGQHLAAKQHDDKTRGELSEALLILDADDEDW